VRAVAVRSLSRLENDAIDARTRALTIKVGDVLNNEPSEAAIAALMTVLVVGAKAHKVSRERLFNQLAEVWSADGSG
jgi:hypothetical protein